MKPSTGDQDRTGPALVLGAGGTKGWAHAGVISVLHDAGVPIDLVVGASAGALIGALYAARRDAAEAERVALGFTPTDFLEWFLNDLRLSPRGGRMGRALWRAYGRLDFHELAVPFACLALDVATRRPVVLRTGSVGRAVEASIRPPIISSPVPHDGFSLVDGGLRDMVPVSTARRLGAKAVVSVNVGELIELPRWLRPFSARVSAAYRSQAGDPASVNGQFGFLAGLLSKGRAERERADVEIRPDMRGISPMWPWHIRTAFRRGQAAARGAMPTIERLLAAGAA